MPEMKENHDQMMIEEHRNKLWVHLTIVALGGWLMTSPVTFGYPQTGMVWSDIVSGALLVIFGFLSLNAWRFWAPWASCFVGLWLGFAPLVFWASSSAAYINDTLIGALVVALSVLIPGMPGMISFMKPGAETPPGWTYNPSAWLQRAPIIGLGFIGWYGSRYLTGYQLDYILVGALIITFAVIAMAEVGRAVRFINVLFGAWLVFAPFILNGFTTGAKWNGVIAGLAAILLSLPRGKVRERYGNWDYYIR